MVAPVAVITKTSSVSNDTKVGIMKTLGFQWLCNTVSKAEVNIFFMISIQFSYSLDSRTAFVANMVTVRLC